MTILKFPAAAVAVMLAVPALAGPPAGALPLSEVLRVLEETGDVAWFEDAEWDDEGYWKIEYHTVAGARSEVRMDPITGLVRE